jgi:hypothetical protein
MPLILRRANVSRKGGHWKSEDYDVFDDERDVGRIYRVPLPRPAVTLANMREDGALAFGELRTVSP